ncbi:nose resistant to fluoxetine protein 6-like [Ornithodoros turicata]|uniref:nose resistant to fluoxetine protein 6-like n=1 Tax=Ornithodoros turicata TaxID=34597 RepID=UPI003138FAB5
MHKRLSCALIPVEHFALYAMAPHRLLVLVLWIICALRANASRDFLPDEANETVIEEARRVWQEQTDNVQGAVENFMKRLFPMLIRMGSESEISTECQGAYLKMFVAIRQLKTWAVKMVDSSGKFPNGALSGTMVSLGHFDECLDIVVDGFDIRGQYCNLQLWLRDLPRPTRNVSLVVPDQESVMSLFYDNGYWLRLLPGHVGLCIPSSCSKEDLEKMATHGGRELKLRATVSSCQTKEPIKLDLDQVIILSVLGAILLLVILGTALDIASTNASKISPLHKNALPIHILVNFSVVKNTRELFRESKRGALDCLDGIRVLSCIWIVLGHIYFLTDISAYIRYGSLTKLQDLFSNFLFTIVENFSLPVDTFFFATGLLLVYTQVKKRATEDTSFCGLCYTFVHRYWRMTPAFALATALFILMPLVGSGPLWRDVLDPVCNSCKQNWWTNLVYISNYMPYGKMCMLHSWFLALNMQYYIIGVPIVLILLRKPKPTCVMLAVLTVVSTVATAAVAYLNRTPPAMLMMTSEWKKATQHLNLVYYQPFTHFGPFAIGLGLGYILSKKKIPLFKTTTLVFGWIMTLAFCSFAVFAVYPFRRGDYFSPAFSAAYAACHRTLWTVGVAWITVLCSSGQAGILGELLSSSVMRPLSKLSYLIYLLHPIPIYIHVAATREAYQLDHYYMTIFFFGVLLASVLMAYLAYIMVELPLGSLENLLKFMTATAAVKDIPRDEDKKGLSYPSFTVNGLPQSHPKAPESSHL